MKTTTALFGVICLTFVAFCHALPTSLSSSLLSSSSSSEEKPEAFLVHLKPKAGQTSSKSKFLLLLRLPDGSTEAVETSPETLSSEASQNSKAVPEVEESSHELQQSTQQTEDEGGFDEQQKDTLNAPANSYSANDAQQVQQVSQHHAEDDAHDQQHHQQHDTQHKTPMEVAQHEAMHHTPEHHSVHTDAGQHDTQQKSNAYPDEQAPAEQLRETPAAYSAPSTSYGGASSAAITNLPANDDRQVPVILIALPPDASPISHQQRLNKILGALGGGSRSAALTGTKGGSTTHVHTDSSHGGRPHVDVHVPESQAPTKGGRTAAAAPYPTGGFGGYGNSHTPSPAGGYGSLAMRLAAKGIKAPTAKDVERPEQLKAILSPVQKGRLAATKGGATTTTHVHTDSSHGGRPHVDVHVESPASHGTKGASLKAGNAYSAPSAALTDSYSRPASAAATKGGSPRTHVHTDSSHGGRPHVDVHVPETQAPTKGGSPRTMTHVHTDSSHGGRPHVDVHVPESQAPTKGGSPRTHVHTDSSHGGRPHVDIHVPETQAPTKGGSARLTNSYSKPASSAAATKGALKALRQQQVTQLKDSAKVYRPSPAAVIKGRNRAAAPAYSSSNNYPTRVEEQESPREVEKETRPVFDDEVDDGLPSRVVSSYEPSDAPALDQESPVSSSESYSEKKQESSIQATTGRYGGKRLVLLLFNRGELDPAVAESAAEAAIIRSENY